MFGLNTVLRSGYRSWLWALGLVIHLVGPVGWASAEEEPLDRGVLGISVLSEESAPDTLKKSLDKVPAKKFMIVSRVSPGGPAEKAGLHPGDVLTRINKVAIEDAASFRAALETLEVGEAVELEGFSAIEKGGRVNWRRGKLKVTPVAYRDLLLGAMAIKKDQVTGATIYRHQESLDFPGKGSDFQLYLVQDAKGFVTTRLRIQYLADDWLFIKQFVIKCDEATFTVTPALPDRVERDNARGNIWEWYDVPVKEAEQEIVDAILSAKGRVILRHSGRQYYKDRELDRAEIDRLRSVLAVRKVLEK